MLFIKILCLFVVSLFAVEAVAQSKSAKVEEPVADTTDLFVIPENAPYFDNSDDRAYILRKVNIHGVKHINHDVIRSSSGLVDMTVSAASTGGSTYSGSDLPVSLINAASNCKCATAVCSITWKYL